MRCEIIHFVRLAFIGFILLSLFVNSNRFIDLFSFINYFHMKVDKKWIWKYLKSSLKCVREICFYHNLSQWQVSEDKETLLKVIFKLTIFLLSVCFESQALRCSIYRRARIQASNEVTRAKPDGQPPSHPPIPLTNEAIPTRVLWPPRTTVNGPPESEEWNSANIEEILEIKITHRHCKLQRFRQGPIQRCKLLNIHLVNKRFKFLWRMSTHLCCRGWFLGIGFCRRCL